MSTIEERRYLLLAQDPVHVGSGGYRLGRVDNSIIREPGANIPKIPGTSLHGAARAYAARLYETPEAAGQSQDTVTNPDHNPVCYTFGYLKRNPNRGNGDETDGTVGYSGVVNVFDAQVVLFPVHSRSGPVWVSTISRLLNASFNVFYHPAAPRQWPDDALLTSFRQDGPLNLGWLMLTTIEPRFSVTPPTEWGNAAEWTAIKDRLVLVKDKLFGQIINSNLEVRTSVSINPETGAASSGLLFTYEALPRGTFLTLDAVIDDYRANPDDSTRLFAAPVTLSGRNNPLPSPWTGPADVFESGLKLVKWLGVGGMGTRGFGRLALVGDPVKTSAPMAAAAQTPAPASQQGVQS